MQVGGGLKSRTNSASGLSMSSIGGLVELHRSLSARSGLTPPPPVPQHEGHPRQRGGVRAERRPGEPQRGRGEGEGRAGSEGQDWATQEELQPALPQSQQVQLLPRWETAQQVRTSRPHQDQGGQSAQSAQPSLPARQTP